MQRHDFHPFIFRYCLLAIVTVFWTTAGAAQVSSAANPDRDTTKETVDILNADILEVLGGNTSEVTQRLIGNVELSQDSIFMYCDSADLVEEVQLYAYDNVIIQQGDSIAAFSNRLDYNAESLMAKLRGEVVLQNGTRELYTDELDYNLATKLATYTTGGRLTDGSTELRSTLGYYYADRDEIYFRDSVVVIGEEFEMRSDTLRYDAANEIVYFLGPTVIRTDTAEIYCEDGFYDVQNDEAVFRGNAQYRSADQIATADSIIYAGKTQLYTLDGRAYVREADNAFARADKIVYDKRAETYQLEGNGLIKDSIRTVRGEFIRYDKVKQVYKVSGGRAEVIDGPMILEADDLDYDEASGVGYATGKVIWRDTSKNLTIVAERAAYNQETGYLKASGGRNDRPLLITLLDGDSLFLTADTLFSLREIKEQQAVTSAAPVNTAGKGRGLQVKGRKPGKDSLVRAPDSLVAPVEILDSLTRDTAIVANSLSALPLIDTLTVAPSVDTQQIIQAYRDVRIYKSDMQALCDSLAFNTTDSILTLFSNPMLWQDTSELTADTIHVYLKENSLDKVHLSRKALVVTSPDSIFFNQVKGKDIYAYFDSTSLSRTDVAGNAEAIYYAQDDEGGYIGVNKTACSEMSLEFKNGGVHFIRFLTMPSGRLDPMNTVNPKGQPTLEGRRADAKLRPRGVDDLFTTRVILLPKAAAEEEGPTAKNKGNLEPE